MKAGPHNSHGLQRQVRQLVSDGIIQLRWSKHLEQAPPALPPGPELADRVEGMMLGLAIGDALGNTSESMTPAQRREQRGWIAHYQRNRHVDDRAVGLPSDDTQLACWTLEHLLEHGHLDAVQLGRLFASRRNEVFGMGRATRAALIAISQGKDWPRCGTRSAGNGALMRIAPVLLPHLRAPSAALWTDALAAAHLTHDDELSNGSCLVLVDLLWHLLGRKDVPARSWWLAHWMEANTAFGSIAPYAARNGHSPGFHGSMNELLENHVKPALAHDLPVDEAGDIWHSGAYLLETVPSVLYILARHGHDPREAMEQAVNNTRDNDTVAAIVGAAVGALHGLGALPDEWVSGLLGRTRSADDGQVFHLLAAAGKRFGYGVTPGLRALASSSAPRQRQGERR